MSSIIKLVPLLGQPLIVIMTKTYFQLPRPRCQLIVTPSVVVN